MVSSPFAPIFDLDVPLMDADLPALDPDRVMSAENIKRRRKSKSLTQSQLGAMSGVSERAVRNWESGAHQPEGEVRAKLADILDLDAGDGRARGRGSSLDGTRVSLEVIRTHVEMLSRQIETVKYLLDMELGPPKR